MLSISASTAFAAGVGSHILYFRRGEHHMSGPWLAALVPVVWTLAVAWKVTEKSGIDACKASTFVLITYALGLYSSMVVYRLFFHPLCCFPGPMLARVTKFWHVAQLSELKNQVLMENLHRKYGEVVRIGPNELVIFRADGFTSLHGPGSKCTKAPWYDMLQKDKSIHATRKPHLHQTRRRIWDQGFSRKALQSYEARVNEKVVLLAQNIARSNGEINCTELFLFFGFEVMGETAFGEGFGMLESGKEHPAVEIMRSGIFLIGRLTPVPWLVTVLASLPGANSGFAKLEEFSQKQVLKRIQMESGQDDVMSRLIEAARDPIDMNKIDLHWPVGDALVMIIAGSDTVSITLTFLFYQLALNAEHVEILRKELRDIDITNNRALQSLPYLNALIDETLRLYPPVPTGALRQTPPTGLNIGPHFIPGGVTVSAPLWSLGRLESSYAKADEFIPERWLPESDMIKDKSGYGPFLAGKHACLGKQLALIELRLVTAKLVTAFDFFFAENDGGVEVLDVKDCFTAVPGPLRLLFKHRK